MKRGKNIILLLSMLLLVLLSLTNNFNKVERLNTAPDIRANSKPLADSFWIKHLM